jgi:hypothetical protein
MINYDVNKVRCNTKISITRPMSLASGWHNYSKYFQIFADGYLIVAGIFLSIR